MDRIKGSLTGLMLAACVAMGQAPTAAMRGTIFDSANAVVPGATVVAKNKETGASRTVTTRSAGQYQVENLEPGAYEVSAAMPGFKTEIASVTLQVGDNASLNFTLQVGQTNEAVTVTSEAPQINTTDYSIAGSVSSRQVNSLPLNGRNFLELAELQSGVTVQSSSNPGALGNTFVRVTIGGAQSSQTRISVDGATVNDRITGGSAQNFSMESVQEFQISTFNFDLSTSTTSAGAINIVSKRGTNSYHGSGFFYYRDHNLSAYPGLGRDLNNLDPYFARKQAGFSLGGPIKKDKLFFFTNYDYNKQLAAYDVQNNSPVFNSLNVISPSPLNAKEFNLRLDANLNPRNTAFLRYSLDNNNSYAPPAAGVFMPSNWQASSNLAFQVQAGLVSVLSPAIVNDARYSFGYFYGVLGAASAAQCVNPVSCVGLGEPQISVFDAARFKIGNQQNVPTTRFPRTYQLVDNITWQKGSHRIRFGGEWEHDYFPVTLAYDDPAIITLWGVSNLTGPAFASIYNALPATLKNPSGPPPAFSDIMQLPLQTFTMGIGSPQLPGPYNYNSASRNDRIRFFAQDSWRLRPNFTLNYGLAYSYETNLFNSDLRRPAYLAPLLAGDLNPPQPDTRAFDPALGFAWSLGKDAKTVIRGGAGIYHDAGNYNPRFQERALVGPSGNGRYAVTGQVVGLNFVSVPTTFTGAQLLPMLPTIEQQIMSKIGNGTDPSVSGIQIVKQGGIGSIFDPQATMGYGMHTSIGVQRQIYKDLVLSADYVMRRFVHFGVGSGAFAYSIDRNQFNRPLVSSVNPTTGVVTFARNPVIPLCTTAQSLALDPNDNCSAGAIPVVGSGANSRYQALNLKLDKRFANGFQLLATYVYAQETGFVGFVANNNFDSANGNIVNRPQQLTVSAVYMPSGYKGSSAALRRLLNGWSFSLISQTASGSPGNTLIAGLDLNGDGISNELLPGVPRQNEFGSGLSANDIRILVTKFNSTIAAPINVPNANGTSSSVPPRTPFNQVINPIVLPATFAPDDSLLAQDLRVSRDIPIRESLRVSIMAEAFNLFNFANLTGYSSVLNQPNFGQPSGRVGQAFGSGGPRSFQFAARVSF